MCAGITNQRETTLVWDSVSGEPIYNGIVWQDRRTADYCSSLKEQNLEQIINKKTGLLLDPYFSATKISWILDNVEGARKKAMKGDLRFGTVDTYLLWHLSGGQLHKTDVTNASRTNIFNIHSMEWDQELLNIFDIPASILPEVVASDAMFGNIEIGDNSIPICGVLGDQQSALVGQNCFQQGDVKNTYGTGCFLMVNTKDKPLKVEEGLLTTVAYKLNNEVNYALEGSIYSCGNIIQWLRDKMQFFENAKDSELFLDSKGISNNVHFFIPAFTGLGAPQWNPDIRASFYGITRDTSKEDFITAAFNSLCYQTKEILIAMKADGLEVKEMSIDGGMANNTSFAQLLSDITSTDISIPANTEATALGAAKVAAVGCGLVDNIEIFDEMAERKQLVSNFSQSHKINFMIWKEYLDTMLTLSTKLKNIMNNKD